MTNNDYQHIVEPVIFWLWNENPTREKICRQLDQFLAQGIRSVSIHPMPDDFRHHDFHGGMKIPYLSEQFFEFVSFTCAQIKLRQMTMWLYDEGGWPSGSAGGSVVRESPDYGVWALTERAGKFETLQYLEHHSYPDLMNPEATRSFIRHTHEKYRQSVGIEFGRTVKGIFTDEPRLMGRLGTDTIPWSPLLPSAFEEQHGYSLETILPYLFKSESIAAEDNLEARKIHKAHRDYLNTVSNLIAENYYGVIEDWCGQHDLLFEGHHPGEDEWSHHGQYFGDYLQQARHYHVPGVDAIWRQIFPGQRGGNYVSLASSVSWLAGRRVALSECYGVYGAGLTLEQMRWIASFHLVRGVNKLFFMASPLSTQGASRINLCGVDFTPNSPYYSYTYQFIDYVRRAAHFSVSGEPQPRIGVFYRSELVPETEAGEFDENRERLCERLHDAMSGLLFAGVGDLKAAHVENGNITVGSITLAMLTIQPHALLDVEEKRVLHRLASKGANLVWVGNREGWINFRDEVLEKSECHSVKWVEHPEDVEIANISPFETEEVVSGIRVLPLQDNARKRFLVFNQNASDTSFKFRMVATTSLRQIPFEEPSATVHQSLHKEGGSYTLSLKAGELCAIEAILLEETTSLQEKELVKWRLQSETALPDGWEVARESEHIIADDIQIKKVRTGPLPVSLGDYSLESADFSGTLCYRMTFDFDCENTSKAVLDLGTVFYCATVTLNGQICGERGWSPFQFDITHALLVGTNALEIRVSNTMANQWARPEIRCHDFEQWHSMYLEKTSPFIDESCHAGLQGPVVLKTFEPIKNLEVED